ncbi:MAG: hypothetical protein RBS68_05995 [Anaerolineales bacterium]|nr:hypothetical protein [Anaerolineales bacterium]
MIGKFFDLVGKLFMLGLVVLLSGVLYVGAVFYQKSGEPMTVAESQRRAPGLTFRDFWASRVEHARYWDEKLSEAGTPNKVCEPVITSFTVYRALIAPLFVFQVRRIGKGDEGYYNERNAINNGALPSMELLYEGPFLDAAWATFEAGSWWQFANDSGTPSSKVPGGRMCKNSYPTPADVSANRPTASGALP